MTQIDAKKATFSHADFFAGQLVSAEADDTKKYAARTAWSRAVTNARAQVKIIAVESSDVWLNVKILNSIRYGA